MIEYSCFVRKGKGPRCQICHQNLIFGDPYARIQVNRYANPYFHAACLSVASNLALAEAENCEEIEKNFQEKEQTRRKKLKEKSNPIEFKKQVIRDALKLVGVNIQHLSITQIGNSRLGNLSVRRGFNGRSDIICVLRVAHSVEIAFKTDGSLQVDGLPTGWPARSRPHQIAQIDRQRGNACSKLNLCDPQSLEKLGKALLKHDSSGGISSRVQND